MNTRLILVSLSLLAVLALSSCSGGSTSPLSVDPTDTNRSNQFDPVGYTVIPIIAGQNYTAGELTVWNDEDTIYFDVVMFDDWFLNQVHIDVADDYLGLPKNKQGKLVPGHFQFSMNLDPAVQAYTFELPNDYEEGESFVFSFHCVVTSATYGQQTGWAGCQETWVWSKGNWCEHDVVIPFCEIYLPGCTGDYQAKYYYPGTKGYWDVEFFNMPDGYDLINGIYPAWCLQQNVYATPGTLYDICAYSSYDEENLPPSLQGLNWEAIAWILNHKHPLATIMDIQEAIWHYALGTNTSDPEALAMIADADANSAGYVPGAGELMAVILYVSDNVQAIFVEVEILCSVQFDCITDLPSCTNDYQAKYYYPGTVGYWDVEFFNVPEGYDIYNGIFPAWCLQHDVYAYPNYLYDICAYAYDEEGYLPPSLQGLNWEAITWVLNHKHPDATIMDIQEAIWHYAIGWVTSDPEALAMIADADANSDGYEPGAGNVIPVILFVSENVQAIFVEVEILCL